MQVTIVNLTGREVQVRMGEQFFSYPPDQTRPVPRVTEHHVRGDVVATVGRSPSVTLQTRQLQAQGVPPFQSLPYAQLYLVTRDVAVASRRPDFVFPDGDVIEAKSYIICDGWARYEQ